MYLKEPRTSCWSEKEKWHYCQQLVLILIAGFHLSSHFFLMAYSAKSNILTYSFMCHILPSASEVEKKKKKGTVPCLKIPWTWFLTSQRADSKDFTSVTYLSVSLRARAKLQLLSFFQNEVWLFVHKMCRFK